MDLMQLIEAHTTYAPRAAHLEPALSDRSVSWKRERQARFDVSGLPRGLSAVV